MLTLATIAATVVLASAGAAAAGVQEAVVPLMVAVITGGPAWFSVRRGQADVVKRLDRLEDGLTEHRDYHLHLWPGLPVGREVSDLTE